MESASVSKLVKEYIGNPEFDAYKIIYVSSKAPLGTDLYEKYRDSLSDSMTFAHNDKGNENERRREALKVLNQDWGTKIEMVLLKLTGKTIADSYTMNILLVS